MKVWVFATPSQVYIKEYVFDLFPVKKHFTWALNEQFTIQFIDEFIKIKSGAENEVVTLIMDPSESLLLYGTITHHLKQRITISSYEKRKLHLQTYLSPPPASNYPVLNRLIDRNFLLRDGCKLLLTLTNRLERLQISFLVFLFPSLPPPSLSPPFPSLPSLPLPSPLLLYFLLFSLLTSFLSLLPYFPLPFSLLPYLLSLPPSFLTSFPPLLICAPSFVSPSFPLLLSFLSLLSSPSSFFPLLSSYIPPPSLFPFLLLTSSFLLSPLSYHLAPPNHYSLSFPLLATLESQYLSPSPPPFGSLSFLPPPLPSLPPFMKQKN